MYNYLRNLLVGDPQPELLDTKAVDYAAAEPRAALSLAGIMAAPIGQSVDWYDAEKMSEVEDLVKLCPVAQRCVDIRADKLSSVLINVTGGVQGKLLLDSPNARDKTLSQNIYIWTNDLTLAGELWLMLDLSIRGRPQLWRVRPDLLKRDPVARTAVYDDGRLNGKPNPRWKFWFDEAGDCIKCVDLKNKGAEYDAFLIRIAHHNPTSDAAGKSSMRSVLRSIKAWLDLQTLLVSTIKRGGPAHAVTIRNTIGMTDEDYAILQSRIQSASAQRNGMAVIPEADLVATGSTFSDMNLPEIKKALEWDIMTGLAVPPPMVGVLESIEYAAQRGAERIFYKTWVKPEAEWLFAYLQAYLRQYLNEPNLTIEIDETHLTFTEDDRIERAEKYNAMGVFSINEVRAELGFDAIPGGETVAAAKAAAGTGPSPQASRAVDRALGTQSAGERAVDEALKPREVSLNADTDNRRPVEPSDNPSK